MPERRSIPRVSRLPFLASLGIATTVLCFVSVAASADERAPAPAGSSQESAHTHHQPAVGSKGAPPGGTEPSKPIETPSWFAGGEGLFVPPYYDTFRGIDLAILTDVQKERFLHWVNTEYCACGQSACRRDTIANCYTNDRTCSWAPARVRRILELVKGGATLPWAPFAARTLPR